MGIWSRRISGLFRRSFFRRNSFRRSLFPQSSFQRSLLFSIYSLYRMVMVGTKWEESARVEMLFSWCCRWFFPITRPAVHELERNVTTAEHTATMRYLMNAFMFWLISILPPFSFVSRRRISERISSLSGWFLFRMVPFRESSLSGFSFSGKFPFGFILLRRFPVRDSKDSLQGLESGLTNFGLNFSFPVREKYFPS